MFPGYPTQVLVSLLFGLFTWVIRVQHLLLHKRFKCVLNANACTNRCWVSSVHISHTLYVSVVKLYDVRSHYKSSVEDSVDRVYDDAQIGDILNHTSSGPWDDDEDVRSFNVVTVVSLIA